MYKFSKLNTRNCRSELNFNLNEQNARAHCKVRTTGACNAIENYYGLRSISIPPREKTNIKQIYDAHRRATQSIERTARTAAIG